jgi:hypothetical protein
MNMTKNIVVPFLFFCVTAGFSQDGLQYGGSAEDAKALNELNEQHAKAFATGDSRILSDKILADDYILISNSGKIYRKGEVVNQVASSKTSAQSIASHSVENVKIRFVSPDVAMVYARVKFKLKNGTIASETQYNDIYAKRNGVWVCVSGNNTSVGPSSK